VRPHLTFRNYTINQTRTTIRLILKYLLFSNLNRIWDFSPQHITYYILQSLKQWQSLSQWNSPFDKWFTMVSCLVYSSILKMKATCSSETKLTFNELRIVVSHETEFLITTAVTTYNPINSSLCWWNPNTNYCLHKSAPCDHFLLELQSTRYIFIHFNIFSHIFTSPNWYPPFRSVA
jgi:hypothetical protein